MGMAERPHGQIQPMARGIEIADSGRYADAVAAIARPRPDAGRSRIVMVPDVGIAELARGLMKGAIYRLPGVGARTFDPDRAAGAVKVALRVAIVFELAVKRKNLRKTPLRVAPGGPFVEILGRTPQRNMPVHRGASAGDLAARVGDLAVRRSLRYETPIMRPRRNPRVQQIGRGLLDGGIVGPGLEQHHAAIGILAQPGGEHRPGRTGTDHDVIVIHNPPHPR